jgi:hypothetical protein
MKGWKDIKAVRFEFEFTLNIWWIPSESADGAGFTCGEDKR